MIKWEMGLEKAKNMTAGDILYTAALVIFVERVITIGATNNAIGLGAINDGLNKAAETVAGFLPKAKS